MQTLRVPPRDPPERRQFQVHQILEGLASPDEPGLVRAVGALGHGVVVRVADRAGRGKHAEFPDPGGAHEADVPRAMVGMVHETVRAAMRGGPWYRLFQRLQRQLPGVHGGGARPSDDPAGEHVGGERRVAERAVGHAHVGDVGHVQPVRRLRLEPAFHEVGPAARALRRSGGDGRPAAAHAADSRFPHDVHHLVAADLGRIPAPRQQLGVRLAVPVHGHEEIGMDLEDAAGQRLVPGGHAADGPGSEHAVAARRDEPAVQRSGQHPADRPDPETVLEFVDVSDHQRRVGSSRAAKKADAVVNISFARLNRATSARKLLNSAIASSADCLVSAATVASVLLRQRRSVSGATPRSLATCSIALVSDEYEPRDSVNSLTAFALNSGVYLVPFAMVPSSPIELGEMRNKNQFISSSVLSSLRRRSTALRYSAKFSSA